MLLAVGACGSDDGDSGTNNSDEVTLEGDSGSATVKSAYGDEPEVSIDGTFEVGRRASR